MSFDSMAPSLLTDLPSRTRYSQGLPLGSGCSLSLHEELASVVLRGFYVNLEKFLEVLGNWSCQENIRNFLPFRLFKITLLSV